MREDEEIIYDFLTQIYRDRDVADATFERTVGRFGEKGVTDIIGLASYYGITAMSLVAARATFPPGDEPVLADLTEPFPR
jgi:4-carboxymuconolactone decarboxylase